MVELGDEHRRHAIERGAALGLHGLEHRQRIEGIRRIDHGCAMGHAAEVGHHHAEAVVKRHRRTQPVFMGQLDRLADEKAVVQDVAMSQGRALRKAGGARGELDIDRVVELQGACELGKLRTLRLAACFRDLVKVHHARGRRCAEPDHTAQVRQCRCMQVMGCGGREFGGEILHDRQVVAGLERRCEHQRLALDLVECVLEFGPPIGRIDVDQDQARLGGCELHQRPFRAVGRPDADPVAGDQTDREQTSRQRIDPCAECCPCPSHILVTHDQRVTIGITRDRAIEGGTDGLADQLGIGGAVVIGQSDGGHGSLRRMFSARRACKLSRRF